jgi:FlaA1/EpsC-like NDP-sugar epimerase
MFVAGNAYSGEHSSKFSVVRYGNVMGSRGSVIPFFFNQKDSKTLPITDPRMTRFMISLEDGVELVWKAFEDMCGGEIYVKKIPSIKITDLAKIISPNASHDIIGIRPGEKLHEQMISMEDALSTYEYDDFFKILPVINDWGSDINRIQNGKKVDENFIYSSETNTQWVGKEEMIKWIEENKNKLGKI